MNPMEQRMIEHLEMLNNETVLDYYSRACGATYIWLLPAAALLSFLLTLFVVWKGKGPTIGPALVLTAPMAAYLGLYATLDGLIAISRIIEMSGTTPELRELTVGVGNSLVTFVLGMLLSIPSYCVAVVGAAVRAFKCREGR